MSATWFDLTRRQRNRRVGLSRGTGLLGRILARATEAVLAAGAIRLALEQLARELEPALAA